MATARQARLHPKFSCGSILSKVVVVIIIKIIISPNNKGPTRAQGTHSSHIYYSTIGSHPHGTRLQRPKNWYKLVRFPIQGGGVWPDTIKKGSRMVSSLEASRTFLTLALWPSSSLWRCSCCGGGRGRGTLLALNLNLKFTKLRGTHRADLVSNKQAMMSSRHFVCSIR